MDGGGDGVGGLLCLGELKVPGGTFSGGGGEMNLVGSARV